jgi:hypothetical protein
MPAYSDPAEGCRHDRAPLRRLGKIIHERTGKSVYVLVCPVCGFTVTTDQLRQLRREAHAGGTGRAPRWAPGKFPQSSH